MGALAGGVVSSSSGKFAIAGTTDISNALSPNITGFLNNRTYSSALPKAYLNYILVDEQFNYVGGNSGVVQVQAGSSKQVLAAPLQNIAKNGYLYVYVSNESPQDVFFDDITVKHTTGPLVQEQSFYPFGLQMSAISSKAILKTTDPYKYNAGCELEEELNYYNTFYRKYDAQIGRFTGVDIRSEESAGLSVYNFGADNTAMYNDPLGDRLQKPEPEQFEASFSWNLDHGSYLHDWSGQDPFGWGNNFGGFSSGGGGGGNGGGGSLKFVMGLYSNVETGTNVHFYDFKSKAGNYRGNTGNWFAYSFSLDDGVYNGFGKWSTLNTEGVGTKFLKDGEQGGGRPNLGLIGNSIRSQAGSEFSKDMFQNYWLGGGNVNLTQQRFNGIVKTAGSVVSSRQVMLSNGQPGVAKIHDFYKSSEYSLSLGKATIYYNQVGSPVGFYDNYDFDPKSWGVRSFSNEMKTRAVNAAGALYGATPFNIYYGIRP